MSATHKGSVNTTSAIAGPPSDWSRNHRVRAGGKGFRDAIWLDGYSEQSVWGWDPPAASFFAQLWRDGRAGYEPDLWLGTKGHWVYPHMFVPPIVDFTDEDPLPVVRALGLAAPSPTVFPPRVVELSKYLDQHASTADENINGQRDALRWLLGEDAEPQENHPLLTSWEEVLERYCGYPIGTPSGKAGFWPDRHGSRSWSLGPPPSRGVEASRQPLGPEGPSPAQLVDANVVDAEKVYVTGLLNLVDSDGYVDGVDEALHQVTSSWP